MIGIKQTIDLAFIENWTETQVVRFGSDDKVTTIGNDYIMVKAIPLSSNYESIDKLSKSESLSLQVICYSKDYNNAIILTDKVLELLDTIPLDFRVDSTYDILDLENGYYAMNVSSIVRSYKNEAQINFLVDGSGNFLIDGSGNYLTAQG